MLNSLNRRDILGTFLGAFIGTLISYFSVGQWIGHVYTLIGTLLGATAGYYIGDITRSTLFFLKESGSIGSFLIETVGNKSKSSLRSLQAYRRLRHIRMIRWEKAHRPHRPYNYTRFVRSWALRLTGLVIIGLYVLSSYVIPGHWSQFTWTMYCVTVGMSIAGVFWASYNMKRRSKDNVGLYPLGCRELQQMGASRFSRKVFLVSLGFAAEITLYLWPCILAILCLGFLLVVAVMMLLCCISTEVAALVFIFRVLVFAVSKKGHWFSFAIASITIFLSMWFRPWTGDESFGVAVTIACMNAGVAVLIGILIRIAMQRIVLRYHLEAKKIDFSWPVLVTVDLVDKHLWTPGSRWLINLPERISKKVPLVPSY